MFVLTVILSLIAAAVFGTAGVGKLAGSRQVTDVMDRVRVGPALRGAIGVLEILAAVGVIVGLWVEWIGIVAAIGLILLMIGAIAYHVRAGDRSSRGLTPPVALLVLVIVLLITRSVSA